MDDTTLFVLSADASPVVAALSEIDAMLASLEERLATFGAAFASLDSVTVGLEGMAEGAVGADGAAAALSGTLDGVTGTAAGAAAASDALAGSLAGVAGAADATATSTTASAAATDVDTVAKERNKEANIANAGSLSMLALGIGAVVAGFAYLGVQAQNSLSIVGSLTGATAAQMQQYTAGAIQLSNQVGSTLKATGDGLYYVVSAGFTGADAMKVLEPAMKDAASGGADLAEVADGLTSALNAFGAGADQATHYSDIMIKAVTDGKQTFGDFARSIGVASVTGKTAGFSFEQVAAAEATMTQNGLSAHRAVMDLDFLMRSIGLSVDKVAKTADGLGLSFDKTKFASLDLIGKLEYLKEISGGNMGAFEKLVGGANGLTAAQIILADGGKAYTKVLGDMKNSSGATADAFKIHEETISAHANHAAAAFSILAYRITELATPAVNAVFTALTGMLKGFTDFVTNNAPIAIPLLGALAAVISGVLVTALWLLVEPLVAAVGAALPIIAPIAAIVAVLGLLAFAIKQAWEHSEQFRTAVKLLGDILGQAWKQLQAAFNDPALKDALKQLGDAFKQILPVLGVLAFVVGIAVVGVIYLIVASIRGLLGALPGIITMFNGIGNVLAGFVRMLVDIFTNWDDIPAALNQMTAGIMQIFGGFFQMIFGAFRGFFNTFGNSWDNFWNGPAKGVKDFVDKIVKFFQDLYDKLVGHSIVPDMFRDMLAHFTQFPLNALNAILSLNDKLLHFFTDLAAKAIGWGRDMVQGLLDGMLSLLNSGAVDGAARGIAGAIAKYLHFTHPDTGPLSDADQWMPHFGDTLSRGMEEQGTRLNANASQMAAAIAAGVKQSSESASQSIQDGATLGGVPASTYAAAATSTDGAGLGGSKTVIDLLQQMVDLEQQMVNLMSSSASGGLGGSSSLGGSGFGSVGSSGASGDGSGSQVAVASQQGATRGTEERGGIHRSEHYSGIATAEEYRALEERINRNNEERMNRARRAPGAFRTHAS